MFLDIYRGQSPGALLNVSCQYSKLRKYSAFTDSFVVAVLVGWVDGGLWWLGEGGGGGVKFFSEYSQSLVVIPLTD